MSDQLDGARKGRSEVAQALRALEAGSVRLEELLRPPSGPKQADKLGALARADVWAVLLRTPRLNRKGAKKVCIESGVFPHKRLGELSDVERELLIAALPKRVTQKEEK